MRKTTKAILSKQNATNRTPKDRGLQIKPTKDLFKSAIQNSLAEFSGLSDFIKLGYVGYRDS